MNKVIYILLSACFLILICCVSEPEKKAELKRTEVFNPNGDSELALLMRYMFDDCMRVKEDVLNQQSSAFEFDPKAIFTAHATEPEKAASEIYKIMGHDYLDATEAFLNAPEDEKKDRYQVLINTCISCHKKLCPGPVSKISKLYLDPVSF